MPASVAVDISAGGVLLAFDEPLGFATGDRLVISLDLGSQYFHAIGAVTRVERGTDFRTYLAIEFSDVRPEDYDDVLAYLGLATGTSGPPPSDDAVRWSDHR